MEQGKSQEFIMTCNEGYEIDTVLVDDLGVVITDSRYIFSNVTADHTINVSFKKTPPTPSYEIIGNTELYKGFDEIYTLVGFTNHSTVWSVDASYITISNQTNTSCTLGFDTLSNVNKTFTLTALVNGLVVVTKAIKTKKF